MKKFFTYLACMLLFVTVMKGPFTRQPDFMENQVMYGETEEMVDAVSNDFPGLGGEAN